MSGRSPLAILDRPRVAPALAALAFAALAVKNAISPAIDQDPFWLASAARLTLRTGHVPRENTFSFVAAHTPWICHEVGFAFLYDGGLSAMGPAFFALVGILGAALTVGIVTAFVARDAKHRAVIAATALLVLVALPLFYSPPAFASLGLVAGMTALAFRDGFDARRAAICVLLEWLWAQMHGSFPLGVALLVVSAIDSPRGRKARLVAAAAGAALTLVNPYGPALHALVVTYARGGSDVARVIQEHITEFLPLWRAPGVFGPFAVPALAFVSLLAVVAVVRGTDRVRGLFVLALAAMATLHTRHILLAIVVGSMLVARTFDSLLSPTNEPRPHPRRLGAGLVLPGVAVAIAALALTMARHPRAWWLGTNLGGQGAAALIDELPDGARVYAPFGVAPVVTWYAFPRGVRVLYDPRNDCYPADVALAALSLEYDDAAERAAADTVSHFGADWALARAGSSVEASFAASPAWRRVDEKPGLALFARR